MHTYQHEELNLSTDAIRLVRLHKGYADPIRCDLLEASLHDIEGIPYEALSYTWGNDSGLCEIIVNDNTIMRVNKNLHVALRNLMLPDQDRVLWVDAMCIDQRNNTEKTHQVMQMKHIYQNAQRVIIWLGESNSDIRLLVNCMSNLDKGVIGNGHGYMSSTEPWEREWTDLLERCGGVHGTFYSRMHNGMEQLLNNAWFHRVWVIQEAASAKTAIIASGKEFVPTRVFCLMPFLMDMPMGEHTRAMLEIMPGPLRKDSWWNQNRDLHTLLRHFRKSRATDPRDKIYALLGISSDTSDGEMLHPDYSIPLMDVIVKTIRFLLFGRVDEYNMGKFPIYDLDPFLDALDDLRGNLFQRASENGSSQLLVRLLEDNDSKMDINLPRMPYRFGSLHHASSFRHHSRPHRSTVETLQIGYADPFTNLNYNDMPPEVLIQHGHEELADLLSEHGRVGTTGRTLLSYAVMDGHFGTAELLTAHPDIDLEYRFGEDNGTALWHAAKHGSSEAVGFLIDKGAHIDAADSRLERTPLWVASTPEIADTFFLLLRNGASLGKDIADIPPNWFWLNYASRSIQARRLIGRVNWQARGKTGMTALGVAAMKGYTNLVKSILQYGAGIEFGGDIESPLCLAVANRHVETASVLIDMRANLETQDASGKTPLAIAAQNGDMASVQLLVSRGASIESEEQSRSPVCLARQNGHLEIGLYLMENGACI